MSIRPAFQAALAAPVDLLAVLAPRARPSGPRPPKLVAKLSHLFLEPRHAPLEPIV